MLGRINITFLLLLIALPAVAQVVIEPSPDAAALIPSWALSLLQQAGQIPVIGKILMIIMAWVPALVGILTALSAVVAAIGKVLAALGRVAGWQGVADKIDAITSKAFKILGYASMFNIQKKLP
jgi:hypothetical protein